MSAVLEPALEFKAEEVKAEEVIELSDSIEWFIAVCDFVGDGECWSCGIPRLSKLEAEIDLRTHYSQCVQGRIIKVKLPCRKIL